MERNGNRLEGVRCGLRSHRRHVLRQVRAGSSVSLVPQGSGSLYQIQISNTYHLAVSVARSAAALPAALKPRSYVRLTFPFYEMKSLPSSSAGHPETAEIRPDGVRGRWWHEVLRGLGSLKDLNSGVIRCGALYGPGTWEGEVIPRVVIGQIYQYLSDEKMKFLHK